MARRRRPPGRLEGNDRAHFQKPKPKPKPPAGAKGPVKPKPKPKPIPPASVASDAGGDRHYVPPTPHPAPAPVQRPAGPDPVVVARQRRLRAAGFPVRVDGKWGARSQTFWHQYSQGVRPLSLAADRRQHIAINERQLHSQIEKIKAESIDKKAARAQIAEAVQGITGAVHGVAASVVQAARRDRFEKALATGPVKNEPGRQHLLGRAIAQEVKQAEEVAAAARKKPPERMSLDELVALTIDPLTGELDPQNPSDVVRVQRWLQAHGHSDLKDDGVFGRSTFEALRTSYTRAVRAEKLDAQRKLVDRLYSAKALHPGDVLFGVGANPDPKVVLATLQKGGFTADQLWADLVQLSRNRGQEFLAWKEAEAFRLAKAGFGPFSKSLFPADPNQLLRSLQLAFGDQSVGALGPARSFSELKWRTTQIEAEKAGFGKYQELAKQGAVEKMSAHEYLLTKAQTTALKEDSSFWKGALDAINYAFEKPGEATQDVLVDQGVMLGYVFSHPLTPRPGNTYSYDDVRATSEAWETRLRNEHPVLNALFDVAVDPWWLVPGANKIGKGFVSLERFGYALNAEGKLTSGLLAATSKRGAGLVLTLPARAGRESVYATKLNLYHLTPDRFRYAAEALSRSKTEAVSRARAKTNLFLSHHFKPRPGVELPDVKVPPKVMKLIEDATPDADRQTIVFLATLYETFRKGRLSFYATAERGGLRSNPAEAVLATFAEYSRVIEVERRATLAAQKEYDNVLYHTQDEGKAKRAATQAFRDVKNQAGSYLVGAPMPGVLGREISDVVQMKLGHLRDVIFPLLQDRLERELDELGQSLFDDAGRWVERGGEVDAVYRQMGRDAFGDASRTVKVRNPSQGRPFTIDEVHKMREEEIGRRIGRLRGWAAREAGHGRPRSEDAIRELADEIRRDVVDAWQRNLDGKWYDKRDELDVLDIYARQQAKLYEGVDPADIPETVQDAIAQLPARPGETVNSPLQVELRNLAWSLGGAEHFAQVSPILNNVSEHLRPVGINFDEAQKFADSIAKLSESLGLAYQRAYPYTLRSEYAAWRALAEARSLPLKIAYKGLAGVLRTWIFLTLPFRPGWAVRNVVDNFAKIILAGVHDPRVLMLGAENPGAQVRHVFQMNVDRLGLAVRIFDKMFRTDGAGERYWHAMMDHVWEMGSDVLKPQFDALNVPVPQSVLDSSLFRPWSDDLRRSATVALPPLVPRKAKPPIEDLEGWAKARDRVKRSPRAFQDGVWELMAARPESYFKRVLYRSTYFKTMKRELDAGVDAASAEITAFREAWEAVEKHLFDYSQESVVEENLRFVFPFVQFWRKNTLLWAEHFVNKPWLPREIVHYEDAMQDEINADLPEWTRRYINSQELGNQIAKVPGLRWLGDYVANLDVMYDPLNFFSFAPLYRAFKNENPLLPADKPGWKFIAPMVDAMNEWGLSMNPLLRKPLEVAGVFSFRAWQSVFPQTPVVQAFTREHLKERFPEGINVEAIMFDPLFGTPTNEAIAESRNQFVQLEMANQAVRGEPVDRAKAEKKVDDYFYLQSLVGYFTGTYIRRMTPEDFYLYGLAEAFHKHEDNYADLSDKDKVAYRLYKFRKIDRVEFDNYVANIPLIQAYYELANYDAKEAFKKDHPEVIPYVEPIWAGKGLSRSYVQTAALVQDTAFLKQMQELASDLELPEDVRLAAESALVTPSMRAFWDKTPKAQRDKHLRLLYFRHMQLLNDLFHEIPATDYDAKRGYLEQNPLLVHWWHQNDQASDEYLGLINQANADLREAYFERVDAGDWSGAGAFLHKYPFIFEFTKAADRVDDDGNWISKRAGSHGFFGRGRHRGRLTEHASDYLAVKSLLDKFFGMGEFDQQAWLEHDGPEQKRVLAYFKKWGSKDGHSEHARAFAHAKPALDVYFGLPKQKRKEWLNGGSPQAKIALDYFKRWSKMNYLARLWKQLPESKNPELARRLKFWHTYFSLSPAERPLYATREAERHGVFIYGPLSQKEREKRESAYLRKLYAHGVSRKASYYIYVQPLLDEWHKLKSRSDKQLFLRANPELGQYLDEFSSGLATGHKKLDGLLEAYFNLPDRSPLRSKFLQDHPEVQDYFDEHSTPAERAMHRLLEVYFKVPVGPKRRELLLRHPEIRAYFDQRKLERDLAKAEADVFAELDPRLKPYREFAKVDQQGALLVAEREARRRRESHRSSGLEVRRDRRS